MGHSDKSQNQWVNWAILKLQKKKFMFMIHKVTMPLCQAEAKQKAPFL